MTAEYDEYKKILLEAGLEEETDELSSLLKELSTEPHKYGRVEAPAGYENQLIASLRTRLPLDAKPVTSPAKTKGGGFWERLVSSPRLAWSFSGTFAVMVAVLAFQGIRNVEPVANNDFLMQTAQKGNSEAVERWLSSVADLGVQVQHNTAGVKALSDVDKATAQKALDDVARSLGYEGDI